MRPQERRRYPDEAFYFDVDNQQSELVVDKNVLPEFYPRVRILRGRTIVEIYEDAEGRELGKGVDWADGPFPAGSQLLRIETSNGKTETSWTRDEQHRNTRLVGAPEDKYEIAQGDVLIAEVRDTDLTRETIVLDANAPFPPDSGQGKVYSPAAIMTLSGELISWDGAQERSKWLSEVLLANTLVTNAYEMAMLRNAIGRELKVLAVLSSSGVAKTYLSLFRNRFGVDYVPLNEPADRCGEFDEELTDEQRLRIWRRA